MTPLETGVNQAATETSPTITPSSSNGWARKQQAPGVTGTGAAPQGARGVAAGHVAVAEASDLVDTVARPAPPHAKRGGAEAAGRPHVALQPDGRASPTCRSSAPPTPSVAGPSAQRSTRAATSQRRFAVAQSDRPTQRGATVVDLQERHRTSRLERLARETTFEPEDDRR